jgi:hypothetical protein
MMSVRAASVAVGVGVVAVAVACLASIWHAAATERVGDERAAPEAPRVSQNRHGYVLVTVRRGEPERIGLKTETLAAETYHARWTAYGVVLDPAPLLTLNGDLLSATAALSAARAEFERAQRLHAERQNVSLKDLQAAEATFRGDQARVALLTQRIADNWGEGVAAMSAEARGALIAALVQRSAAIAAASLPPGQSLAAQPSETEVVVFGYEKSPLVTHAVWYAPAVDLQLQGQRFLLHVATHAFPLLPGAAVTAHFESPETQHGVVVPEAAVVRAAGQAWAYVQIAPARFERRPVALAAPSARGWFMTTGFAAGDRVVVTGAQALLSEEFKSQIHIED